MVRPPRSVDDLVVAVISLAEGIAEGQSSSAQRIELQALSHKLQSQIKVSLGFKLLKISRIDDNCARIDHSCYVNVDD